MKEGVFRASPVMQRYFKEVVVAERERFGEPRLSPFGSRVLPMSAGELNSLPASAYLEAVEEADLIIVFGASYIKQPLVDLLVDKKAINIHLGVSPYYRGSSCNFWALYDKHPEMVGATIHYLSKGLDSGPMLFHCLPQPSKERDSFFLGMMAVEAALRGLISNVESGEIFKMEPAVQDKNKEMRYSCGRDFTDEIAEEYLANRLTLGEIKKGLEKRNMIKYLRPYILEE